LKNAASVVKQSKPVFCALLERFIIQNASSVPTVNAFWMEFLLLKIQKKELIVLPAIKSKLCFSRRTRTRARISVDTNPKNSFYRLHSPKCFKCGKPICPEPGEKEALRIIAMDKSFHKACFVCEKCNISLTDSKAGGCYPVNDKFFCKQCSMAEINEQMKRT